MGAYLEMTNIFGDLVELAEKFDYPLSSICVLKGDVGVLEREYPDTFSNLLTCKHNKDYRTPIEYGQDLVASWIYEDLIVEQLTKAGLKIEGAGADKEREILPHVKVSASSDCKVSYNGKEILLEIMNDYKGYWTRYKQIDLRDSKYNKLVKESSLFLGISTKEKKYILLDFGKGNFEAKYVPSHWPYGGKPAYQIKISIDLLHDIDFKLISKDIIDKLQ